MNKMDVWKRKKVKREHVKLIPNDQALRFLGDSIREHYPDRHEELNRPITPFEDLKLLKVTWNKIK